ncbi:uncharacterized protein METZ01_LOCUS258479, partial [marine metagenome]
MNSNTEPISYIYLETTNYCNLKCSFCNREEVIGKLQHMSLEKFDVLLSKIKNEPVKEAKLMGMGEPFLHPQFSEVCKIFKDYFPESFLIVATNCQYKFSPKFTEALKYIDLLYFSIDGYKQSYERDRSPATWEKLLKFLNDFKDTERYGCRVTINYVVNKNNINDIQNINDEILIPYNLEELRLNIAQDWTEDSSLIAGYTSRQIDYLKNNWKKNIKGKSPWNYSNCFWPKNGLYITVDGRVLMCALNTSAEGFGNIFYQSLDEIRNSEKYSEVRESCNKNQPSQHCKNC